MLNRSSYMRTCIDFMIVKEKTCTTNNRSQDCSHLKILGSLENMFTIYIMRNLLHSVFYYRAEGI